mmetsp:Transcript_15379/g.39963  ORF Transcript_15379/g.39963 Transcript_15379/m.39963 type:complete len:304 (+) Transcript_15379:204-1115(+)
MSCASRALFLNASKRACSSLSGFGAVYAGRCLSCRAGDRLAMFCSRPHARLCTSRSLGWKHDMWSVRRWSNAKSSITGLKRTTKRRPSSKSRTASRSTSLIWRAYSSAPLAELNTVCVSRKARAFHNKFPVRHHKDCFSMSSSDETRSLTPRTFTYVRGSESRRARRTSRTDARMAPMSRFDHHWSPQLGMKDKTFQRRSRCGDSASIHVRRSVTSSRRVVLRSPALAALAAFELVRSDAPSTAAFSPHLSRWLGHGLTSNELCDPLESPSSFGLKCLSSVPSVSMRTPGTTPPSPHANDAPR